MTTRSAATVQKKVAPSFPTHPGNMSFSADPTDSRPKYPIDSEDDVSHIIIDSATIDYLNDPQSLIEAYGPFSLKALVGSKNIALASATAAIGGFLFGFDQGLISIM